MTDHTNQQEPIWGQEVPASDFRPRRHILSGPTRTGSGNVVLRVGMEIGSVGVDGRPVQGWEQVGVVVMTSVEAKGLAAAVLGAVYPGNSLAEQAARRESKEQG